MAFRLVNPGEVDHEMDRSQLFPRLSHVWDAETTSVCDSIYRKYVSSGAGLLIPNAVFCDLPKALFLDYLVRYRSILLMGANQGNLTRLAPVVLSQNLAGWNLPRYMAFGNSIEAIYHAILDFERLARLDHATRSTLVLSEGFYFGLDYRVVGEAPWRGGTVYLYRAADFPESFLSEPFWTEKPIHPIARIAVTPSDWPMLDQVRGVDMKAQIGRQCETYLGYPWWDDDAIHPRRWKRPLAEAMRAYLEANVGESVGLEQLGKAIHASPSVALRIFRAVMGQSPREFQTELRISQAKRMLQQGQPIAEVAVETGFYDQTHLTQHFRRRLGLTPGQYLRAQESPIHRA
jgi:AraC-like DNA-binding protein